MRKYRLVAVENIALMLGEYRYPELAGLDANARRVHQIGSRLDGYPPDWTSLKPSVPGWASVAGLPTAGAALAAHNMPTWAYLLLIITLMQPTCSRAADLLPLRQRAQPSVDPWVAGSQFALIMS
jgi:hypothetical protein